MTWDLRNLLRRRAWWTRDGCKTIAAHRAIVQFDYPRTWSAEQLSDGFAVFDRKPPAHQSRIDVSYFAVPFVGVNEPPVADFVDRVTSRPRANATCGPLREEIRRGIELAWRDICFRADWTARHASLRACLARRGGVHCLITYEYWGDDDEHRDEVWETALATLVLDSTVGTTSA